MKFDVEISKQFKDTLMIEYGIINGDNTIVFIKAGQNGSLYGYRNKYIKMAKKLNKKYGCTVICSSNPFDGTNPLDNAKELIEEYANKFEDYKIYYLGFSNGALIGACFGTSYDKIKRMALVNAPLEYNYDQIVDGALAFNGERITFIYGSKDGSIDCTDLIKDIENDRIRLEIANGQDHYFSKSEKEFQALPEKYLFYDK